MIRRMRLGAIVAAAFAPIAHAQTGPTYDMDWFTIDGGGSVGLAGGVFQMGCSSGQTDAGVLAGGEFEIAGGFWSGVVPNALCYANCDDSTALPLLNVNDFTCFLNRFAAGDPYANCDGSTAAPVLNVNDFQCFINTFAAGCP